MELKGRLHETMAETEDAFRSPVPQFMGFVLQTQNSMMRRRYDLQQAALVMLQKKKKKCYKKRIVLFVLLIHALGISVPPFQAALL